MIEKINKRILVHLGHGTLSLGADASLENYIIYETSFTPVGEKVNINVGKNTDEIDKTVIELRFDGENAIKSIDILIEDLITIKNSLNTNNLQKTQ